MKNMAIRLALLSSLVCFLCTSCIDISKDDSSEDTYSVMYYANGATSGSPPADGNRYAGGRGMRRACCRLTINIILSILISEI